MAILGHGSDLTLAASATPIVAQAGGTVRAALDRLARARFTAVQLDATMRGIRPRELDHRARRDLSAVMARASMRLAGLDLFIPRRHFVEAANLDRAMTATLEAVKLAADLGRAPLSLGLPVAELSDEVKRALVEAADGHGVALAVHAEDELDALEAWTAEVDLPVLGVGLDPAAALARSLDPAQLAHRLSKRLIVARLSDVSADAVRCVVGQGDLSVIDYRVALDLAAARQGPVVLDLRGLNDPLAAAVTAAKVWDDSAFTV